MPRGRRSDVMKSRATFASLALALLCLFGCKRKQPAASDGSTLAQIFADPVDAAVAAPSASTAVTDEPLPSLKHTGVPPPVVNTGGGKPKPSASAAAPAGNPNLPQCVIARAYCSQNKPECEVKKQACLAAGGLM